MPRALMGIPCSLARALGDIHSSFEVTVYGVPGDLDLSRLHAAVLERIDLGQFIVHFRFSGPTEIAVEGEWELVAPDGAVIDRQLEPADREAYRLHILLGQGVAGTSIDPPDSCTLRFESGHQLR